MIKIKVPATSANLGSGFDVLGLAINKYNIFTFKSGLGSTEADSLVHLAYNKVFEWLKRDLIPVEIEIQADIPMSRGLGSSASCIVGGVMGANEVLGCPLSTEEILKLATKIEGHPDNVAPAIYGGLVVSVMKDDEIYFSKVPIKNEYQYLVLVPDFHLSTEKARAALPKMIPFNDGVFNIGRASLLLTALVTGQDELIKIGLEDKLHQSYRGDLIPGFSAILKKMDELSILGCYLSGAGPSIMCMTDIGDRVAKSKITEFMIENYPTWTVYQQTIEPTGARKINS